MISDLLTSINKGSGHANDQVQPAKASDMMSLTVTFAHGPVVTKCFLSGDS